MISEGIEKSINFAYIDWHRWIFGQKNTLEEWRTLHVATSRSKNENDHRSGDSSFSTVFIFLFLFPFRPNICLKLHDNLVRYRSNLTDHDLSQGHFCV